MALVPFAWALFLAVLAAAILLTQSLVKDSWSVEAHFFWRQDVPVLGAMLAITLGLCFAPASWLARLAGPPGRDARWVVPALAATTTAAGAVGVWAVFQGYTFSLDEFLANFDARIFASGRLAAPIAPDWRPYASAMQPMYMLPLAPSAWASSYLPVNAAMRAVARLAHADWLLNPLLSGFSVIATWAVGRRLWPDRPDLALIAAALLGTSSQLIVMAMTAYAMPAHLAFNLAWLWLFLRGGKLGHAGAIAVGFLATGIHQVAFHPLFAAPFVLQLLWRRRWGLSVLYISAYAAICLFWIDYWGIATKLHGLVPADSDSTGFDYFRDRIDDVIDAMGYDSVGAMSEMLARFAAWQNLLLAPLAILGAALSIGARGALRPLVLGVFLTLVVMTIATPTQTHGWGYRYMHGLLGSACLAAAFAWGKLTAPSTREGRAGANGAFVLACAISLVALAPVHAVQAARYVAPYAAANAAIQASRADVVVVDHDSQVLFDMGTLVRNDPLLRRSPKVMALAMMTPPMVRQICADHSVDVFNGASARSFGLDIIPWRPPRRLDDLRNLMAQLRCGRTISR
ncbi:MAG TPA: hypothetical protein VFE13_10480 [Caulobacteraceae bacterium]|nr:hypothetical protein [Caulobacteraceae bacterium]